VCGIESFGKGIEVVRVQVAQTLDRYGGRAVSKHRLDDLYRGVLPDRQGGRVPKVVDAETLAQPGRRHCRALVPLAPLGDPQRSATRHGEHKIGRGVGSVGQVSAKLLGEESWQRNDAALAGLGRPPRQPAVHLGRRLHHLNPVGEQIQPPDP
jgi:hypothetical protein